MQLPVPDIDADDVAGASLQQAVGEAAGRLPDVEAQLAADAEAGLRQRPGKLEAAARDVMRVGVGGHGQRRFLGQFHGRLADRPAGPADAAFLDQPLGRGTRGSEVLGDEQGIRPRHPGRPLMSRLAGRARLFLPRVEGVHAHRCACAAAGLSSGSGRSCTDRRPKHRCRLPAGR